MLISSTFQERERLGDEKDQDFQGAPYELAKRSFFGLANLTFDLPICSRFSDWKRNQKSCNMTDMLCMGEFFLVESVENACKAPW